MRQRFGAKLVVISDLLKMFVQDAQIDPDEARWLLREMVRSLRKLSSQVMVVVSLGECPSSQYLSLLLSIFNNQIHIAPTKREANKLQVTVKVIKSNEQQQQQKKSDEASSLFILVIAERDLRIIPPR